MTDYYSWHCFFKYIQKCKVGNLTSQADNELPKTFPKASLDFQGVKYHISVILSRTDKQECATQGRGNILTITEISSTDQTKKGVFNKTKTSFILDIIGKFYFVNFRGKP